MDGEWRGDGVSEGNVNVVTRGENDDQQAKETDVKSIHLSKLIQLGLQIKSYKFM